MATSNIAITIKDVNKTLMNVAKAHQFQVWDPAMPANTPLTTAIATYGRPAMTITQTGSVGIGTTWPTVALDVAGTITATAFVGDGSQLTGIAPGTTWISTNCNIYPSMSIVQIGQSNVTNNAKMSIYSPSNVTKNLLRIDTQDGRTSLCITNTGNVGIGTAIPEKVFDVYFTHPPANLRYPPKPLGVSPFNLINSSYGIGIYTASSSSSTATFAASNAFSHSSNIQWKSSSVYDASTGAYTGAVSTAGYNGEYLQIQTPNKGFTMTSYSITAGASSDQYGAPKDWNLYVSNDGTNWTLLDSEANTSFTQNETKTFTISNVSSDNVYYRLSINKIQGGEFGINTACIAEFAMYGYPGARQALYVDSENVTISPGYRVGFGTTMPSCEVHVNGIMTAVSLAQVPGSYSSASAPLFSFIDSPSTGIFIPDSNCNYAISTAGIERVREENVFGSVGFGTTIPLSRVHFAQQMFHNGSVGIGTGTPGGIIFAVSGTTILAGNVGIGTTNLNSDLAFMLQLSQDSAGKPSTTTWTVTSDPRLKENIELANYSMCRNVISNIDLKYYKWRDDFIAMTCVEDHHKLGWIATDVQQVFPNSVRTVPNMYGYSNVLFMSPDQLYASMYGTLKYLINEIETLEAEMSASGI